MKVTTAPWAKKLWSEEGLHLPPLTEQRDIVTGEKLHDRAVTVGCRILGEAETGMGEVVGRGGIVIDIDADPDTGEVVYVVANHRRRRDRTEAWVFRMPASEVAPTHVVPDSDAARHAYAKALWRAASEGRYVSPADLELVGVGVGLVRDCVKGG